MTCECELHFQHKKKKYSWQTSKGPFKLKPSKLSHLKVPAVHPNGCLRQWQITGKAKVQRPDARMLGDRESSKRTVKCLPASCDLALRYKELAVVKP